MVKNCGAWGSIAPPITLDVIMSRFSVTAKHCRRLAASIPKISHEPMRDKPAQHGSFTRG
jgi:hypothetical protein